MRNVRLKIALLGDAAVGKTSLRRKFMGKSFATQHLMTIGADFSTTQLEIGDNSVNFQIWDIAGEHSTTSLRSQFYRGIKGALVVFDITRQPTYLNLPTWIDELWKYNGEGEVPIIILGNKADLRTDGSVPEASAKEYASQIQASMSQPFNISYLETSAKVGLNVPEAFELLGKEILRTID